MKKLVFALFLGLFILKPSITSAQNYEDLLILLVDEKYDKCFDKALKYTENEKTKNDPLPYLYASQALYEMSLDSKYKDDFSNAYGDALSFATKYRKKDKSYAYKSDAEPFIEKLKLNILESVENYILDGDEKGYKKALGLIKKVNAMDPDCRGSELLRGELEILTKNKTVGKKMVVAAMERVKAIGTDIQFADLNLSQQKYLKFTLIFSANLQKESNPSEAKSIISIGQPYFGEENEACLIEDNEDFKTAYKKITG